MRRFHHHPLIKAIPVTTSRKIADLDRNFQPAEVAGGLTWYDAQSLPLEGRGWNDTEIYYQRLPARAKGTVSDAVWSISQCTAGMALRFVTDASVISVRWELSDENLAMPHMPASGKSGVDLYGYHDGAWRWGGSGIPDGRDNTANMTGDRSGMRPGAREYLLYLPLYNGIRRLAIGLPQKAAIEPAPPRANGGAGRKPFAVYGTSIVQGGCASRSGMGYVEIMARLLDRPSINLGFSGNGPMDLELAPLLGELDVSAYIIDALPNMTPTLVRERTVPFVTTLRRARPETPIVLVENITYQRAWLQSTGTAGHEEKNTCFREEHLKLLDQGIRGLHWVNGDGLLGDDGLGTVDGTHPNDLGFHRMAHTIAPTLTPLVD